MKSDNKFYLRWKGVINGPFSADDVRDMYYHGKIGLLHSVRIGDDGDWILLRDLDFDKIEQIQKNVYKKPREEKSPLKIYLASPWGQYLIYAAIGASFVSLWFYAAAAVLCWLVWKHIDASSAKNYLISATFSAIGGLIFFDLLYPILAD